jgi:hypothetical protein
MNFSKITTKQLLLILGLIILLVPPIFVMPSFLDFFDFSDKGEIGDTIGGLTSPFINAIGAILVFIAFKEQVKANDLIKEQQYFQHIQEQINRLEDDFLDLPTVIDRINYDLMSSQQLLNNFENKQQTHYSIDGASLNKAIYSTTLFIQTANLIDKMEYNKEFMQKKLKTLYKIIYQDNYLQLEATLKRIVHMQSKSTAYVAELLFQINDLQQKFAD